MSHKLFFRQNSVTADKSNGLPSVCAIITALVLPGVNAASNWSGRAFNVDGSLSMNTGTQPFCKIGATVVGNPAAAVMTSSPGRNWRSPSLWLVSADSATRFAEEPELTRMDFLTPRNVANSFSNASPSGPSVSQKSSVAETAASTSSSSNTRPAYGTVVWPGTNAGRLGSSPGRFAACVAVENSRVRRRISVLISAGDFDIGKLFCRPRQFFTSGVGTIIGNLAAQKFWREFRRLDDGAIPDDGLLDGVGKIPDRLPF